MRFILNSYLIPKLYSKLLQWYFTALLVGICATLNLRIQALKKENPDTNQDIHMKDIILALSWGAKNAENKMPVKKTQLYTVLDSKAIFKIIVSPEDTHYRVQ